MKKIKIWKSEKLTIFDKTFQYNKLDFKKMSYTHANEKPTLAYQETYNRRE